ncbi:MAG: orotate phosphoribosyltransferase [Myxococcota bacterium]|nr:orotate phosphoribosyltransferase [Myxococcota bacterium]
MPSDKSRLIELLLELSYQRRHVVLSSGRESDFYIDGKQTTLHAEGAAAIGRLVLEEIRRDSSIVGVGGLSMGADPIATAAAVASTLDGGKPIHSFYVRKEPKSHGTQEYVEGLRNFSEGARVVVVEDTSTTGASAWKAVERCRQTGFEVAFVVTVVDREEGAREFLEDKGLDVRSLVTRTELLEGSL